MRIYEKVHLVVATPGRILDLMEKKVILHPTFIIQFFVDPNTTFCVFKSGHLEWKAPLLEIKDVR
jgi:hypothetical protein